MDELAIGDIVELTELAEPAPAGARGGVADLLDDGKVIVEVTTLPLEPILDRIAFVRPETLRIIEKARPQA
jgi:hypothetical protein